MKPFEKLKPVIWIGNSKEVIKEDFSEKARHNAGTELRKVQAGKTHSDWKPLRSIGAGVNEIRVHAENEYRVIYVAKFAEAVYVLHAFTKKTQQTSLHDIRLAKQRYQNLVNKR